MTIQLVAGQTFAADYSLLSRLDSGLEEHAVWLALHEPTQERVAIRLIKTSQTDAHLIQANITRCQSLVHPNLLRTYRLETFDGQYFAVSEYKKGLTQLDLSRPFKENWSGLQSILQALDYAHSLGFYHGQIAPQAFWVDGSGTAFLGGFGLPGADSDYLPEGSETPSTATDIYSMAQILHLSLTGQTKSAGQTVPLDAAIAPLLSAMLSSNASDRPADFGGLITLLEEGVQDSNQALSAATFQPVEPQQATAQPTAPGMESVHRSPREQSVVSLPVALTGLAALIVIAVGLFFLLPEATVTPTTTATTTTTTTSTTAPSVNAATSAAAAPEVEAPPVLAPLELARIEELKVKGKNLAAELLRLQVSVEDVGGRLWAGERYEASTQFGITGDDLYRQEDYSASVDAYQSGVDLLEEVLDETNDVFNQTLLAGETAFENENPTAAVEAYEILTRIEPGNADLKAQLNRARNFEQVLRLTQDADVMERNGNLDDAIATYREAASLDGDWQPAVDGVQRVTNTLARRKFQDKMSKGFAALASDSFELAKTEFEAAQAILPNSSEPLDGLQQIELAKSQKKINDLYAEAEAASSEGRWADAIPIYENILTHSPGLTKATRDLAQATERAELKSALEKYVAQPHLMQNDDELRAAKSALLSAAKLDNENLKDLVRNLSHYVSLARVDVPVVLTSNGRTDVTVYKVGEYGRINEVQLSLVPGVYTFVGKRSGYRDVYEEVYIKGDVSPVKLSISCTERI